MEEVQNNPVSELLPTGPSLVVKPLLKAVADQAASADVSREINSALIASLKANDVMRLAASRSIGGLEASVLQIGRELEAIAANCTSTAWVMWNHLAVFHLFAGTLGPAQEGLLSEIVTSHEWVCFPAGAGSGVTGLIEGDTVRLTGKGSFSSGGAYADWAGVVFVVTDEHGARAEPMDLRFTVVKTNAHGVKIDRTWDGASVRASATDDIHYSDVIVPANRCVRWFGANRAESLREVPVIAPRYREDWVGLSDIWLGWMGVGLARAALDEAATALRTRRSIMGKAMVTRPTIQVNLGHAAALISAAAASVETACREVDQRIDGEIAPTEADYLRQMTVGSSAINLLHEAMNLLLRSQGGNGLREGGTFERRWRDMQAMPLHINAHQDRVHHQVGRFILGEELESF